ncbi:MAG: serine/threonine protein phosphatase, partial [Planctomycetota bacterium]|nr:serine/threonine protein phosphatase [Planctomycetota bacterium]
MMLEAQYDRQWREGWLRYGGSNTLFSYGGRLDDVPDAHWEFLRSSINYHQTPTTLFLHANFEPDVELDQQTAQWLRWTHLSGKETPLPTGQR